MEAAQQAGLPLEALCGGMGNCGKCVVRIAGGAGKPSAEEKNHLAPEELKQGYRLACRAKVGGHLEVFLPDPSETKAKGFFKEPGKGLKLHPLVEKTYIRLAPPSLEDQAADSSRVLQGLGLKSQNLPPSLCRKLPRTLREADFKVTLIHDERGLLGVEPGDTTARNLGLVFDLGTTTLAGYLVDLTSGKLLAGDAVHNRQAAHGADIITRLAFVRREKDGLQILHRVLIDALNELVEMLLGKANCRGEDIYASVVVGNTCMQHLFLGLDPSSLAYTPFVPVLKEGVTVSAAEMGLKLNEDGLVHVLPNIAGFVGSDTVAVILSTGLDRSRATKLAIDIGTNGELVLGSRERLLACSAAAGPAFEGARISSGMRAAPGAINKVFLRDDIAFSVIGGGKPEGICGSGLIDAVAILLETGIVNKRGKILSPGELDPSISPQLIRRLLRHQGANAFLLVPASQTAHRRPILITQEDIRGLQLAKGAIAAAIQVLCRCYGVQAGYVEEVFLAGAFGSYLNPKSALRIGLIPPGLGERITPAGNAAGEGGIKALLSRREIKRAGKLAEKVEHVELAAFPGFYELFAAEIDSRK